MTMEQTQSSQTHWEVIACPGGMPLSVHTIWEALLIQHAHYPFYTRTKWTALAAELGTFRNWFALVIKQDEETIGLLPLRRRTRWTAEPTGPFTPDIPTVLIKPGADDDFWQGVAGWLKQASPVAMVSLGHFSDPQQIEMLQRICREQQLFTFSKEVSPTVFIPLAESWEQYLASLGKRTRTNIRYAETYLLRDYQDVRVEIITDPATYREPFDQLIELYRQRWQHQVGGCLLDRPVNVDFHHQIMAWALEEKSAALAVLRVDDRLIAGVMVFFVPGQHEMDCYLAARDMEALPKQYSPGIFLYSHLIRWAIDHGFTGMGMGNGNTYYKRLLGGTESPQWEVYAARSPLAGKLLQKIDPAIHAVRRLPVHLQYHLSHLGKSDDTAALAES
ncbi:MAG: GNAT family N-acetyltransferase [Armatimonadota bacterium]